jgi:hypothetical protein
MDRDHQTIMVPVGPDGTLEVDLDLFLQLADDISASLVARGLSGTELDDAVCDRLPDALVAALRSCRPPGDRLH